MKNMGIVDKIIRVIIGLVLLWSGYSYLVGTWSIVSYVVGVILILSTTLPTCPIYKALGINTCKTCGASKSTDENVQKQESPQQAQNDANISEETGEEHVDNDEEKMDNNELNQ